MTRSSTRTGSQSLRPRSWTSPSNGAASVMPAPMVQVRMRRGRWVRDAVEGMTASTALIKVRSNGLWNLAWKMGCDMCLNMC